MIKPLFTALVGAHNHEDYIEKAVTSVLEQDFPPSEVEVLVLDDGSTDRTPEILRKFVPRIRYLRKENGGQASAYNAAIPEARGQMVALLDGDDWWHPEKLRAVAEAFEEHPDVGGVGHGYYDFRADTASLEMLVPARVFRLKLKTPGDAFLFNSLAGCLGGSMLVARKDLLTQALPLPEEFAFIADSFLYTLAIAKAEAIVLDRPLCYYRVHSENLVATSDPKRTQRKQELQHRYVECMSERLSTLGMPSELIAAVLEPLLVEAERRRLSRYGGSPFRTFRVEQAAHLHSYGERDFRYRIFHGLVLALTLLVPPRRFYKLRQWYADRGFRRLREKLVDSVPGDPILVRRPAAIPGGVDSGSPLSQ
jgi:glycosyltransferase involved in cell wall biosynthesis